jgi:hypothetical protein
MGEAAEPACHELLLRLAGRLPDRQLWRFRDWLAAGALPELGQALPLTLLRERIGLMASELRLVDTALRGQGADLGLLSSVREIDELPMPAFSFSQESPVRPGLGDQFSVLLSAVLRGRAGVGEVRSCWRRNRSDGGDPKRVLVVSAHAGYAALTGELQRVQRALGEHDPCVEVLPVEMEPPPYQWAAIEASELLCTGAAQGHGQLVSS